MRHRVVLAVGSNLGDRLGTLQGCVQAIGGLPDTDVLAISPVYETAPVGGPAQPDYLNAVLIVSTGLPPLDLLAATQGIEAEFGRVRPPGAERFGPRTLDIDVISYADASATTRCSPCPTRVRTSAPSSSPRGTISTPEPACPGGGRWRACSPGSTAAASGASRTWFSGALAKPAGRPGRDPMKPTRVSTLVVVAVVCAAVTWLLLRSFYQSLPPLPWTGVPALLVAALAEAWTGRDLRARIAGRRGLKPAAPLFVSRMVALAKASSLAAAIIAGVAAGFDIYLSGSLSASVPRQDALTAVITFVAAILLVCAALFLEYCCRVPDAPDRDQQAAA